MTRPELFHGIVVMAIRLAFVGTALYALFVRHDYETGLMGISGLVLSFVPALVMNNLKVTLPLRYELVTVLFLGSSLLVGEFFDLYGKIWWWDDMLHALSGVLFGFVGLLTLYLSFPKQWGSIRPLFGAFIVFSVAMASAAVWEVIEYAVDRLAGGHMQYGLEDTMNDMVAAMVGAVVVVGVAYWHYGGSKNNLLHGHLAKIDALNPHLTRQTTERSGFSGQNSRK